MNTPKRIQRKRTKGWKMPENTLYVGRGTQYGNPYRVRRFWDGWHIVTYINHVWTDLGVYPDKETAVGSAVARFEVYLKKAELNLIPLRGKNLACWCKEGEPCHADVLLRLANQ